MCGITGIVALNEIGRISMIHLSAATDTLQQRGPDSRGVHTDYFVGLGHRRLSIIDTSVGGAQPMQDESGRYTLVFNGEIYNYRQLRKGLEGKGYAFQSDSDTEVLLKMYMEYGEACLQHFNGFFAFAIHDKETDVLFIARDRLGIKPLLYYQDGDRFLFASEMKCLLAFGLPRELNFEALHMYLQLNYVPAPHSMLKGVSKLMPGECLTLEKGKLKVKSWYTLPFDAQRLNAKGLSYEQQQGKLQELMELSVQRRLVADVPLGAFLSGGIDSSVITALASRHVDKLNTFSIGYKDEPYFDETRYAKLVADRYKTEHTVFSLTNQDLYSQLHNVLNHIDEPFADSSALPVYILSMHTKKKVTVALSGDGADELFSGYNKHAAAFRAMQGGWKAEVVRDLLPLWRMLPKSRNAPLSNTFRQLQRFAEGMKLSAKDRYWRWAGFSTEAESLRLLSPASKSGLEQEVYNRQKESVLQAVQEGDLNSFLYTDVKLVLPNDMLTKVDSMSMAHGLEVRVPFLDHEVVAFAFQLPAESKINGQMKKRIVQDAFRDLLPPELYNRPKHGFEVPLLKWFRTELRSLIENDLLADDFVREQGVFEVAEVQKLKKQLFSSSPGDVHARIWGLIVFQHWWKRYML